MQECPSAQVSLLDCTRASVRATSHASVRSHFSKTSWTIVTKFHLGHHWGGGFAAYGFGPGRIRTLVSMATDTSRRIIMGENLVSTLALPFFIGSSLFLQVTRTAIKAWMSSKFDKIGPGSAELATHECLKKSP